MGSCSTCSTDHSLSDSVGRVQETQDSSSCGHRASRAIHCALPTRLLQPGAPGPQESLPGRGAANSAPPSGAGSPPSPQGNRRLYFYSIPAVLWFLEMAFKICFLIFISKRMLKSMDLAPGKTCMKKRGIGFGSRSAVSGLVSGKEPHSAPASETFGFCTESPGPAFLTVDIGSSCFPPCGVLAT